MIDAEFDNELDDDIWKYKKYKMTKTYKTRNNSFHYFIKENTIIRNIKLRIKYKDCNEKIEFNNLELHIDFRDEFVHIMAHVNNFIASLFGIKNSIYLIPIVQKNLNSYTFIKSYIGIRLINICNFTHIDKVYIEYEKLKDKNNKKIKVNFLITPWITLCKFCSEFKLNRIVFDGSNIGENYIYSTYLNFAILTTSFYIEKQKKLEFNEMILYVTYYNAKTIKVIEQKKLQINYDDLIIKKFLGNIFYIIPLDEKTISIKNIANNYHKKNKDRKIICEINEVHFIPDIKINRWFDFHIF